MEILLNKEYIYNYLMCSCVNINIWFYDRDEYLSQGIYFNGNSRAKTS